MRHGRSLARRYAMQAIYQWQMSGAREVADELYFAVAKDRERLDRGYYDELVGQVINRVDELDEQLTTVLDRALADVNPVELAVLRTGVCELMFHPEVPYRVVINEAVELAKTFGSENGHKYVNGILDKLALKLRTTETAHKSG